MNFIDQDSTIVLSNNLKDIKVKNFQSTGETEIKAPLYVEGKNSLFGFEDALNTDIDSFLILGDGNSAPDTPGFVDFLTLRRGQTGSAFANNVVFSVGKLTSGISSNTALQVRLQTGTGNDANFTALNLSSTGPSTLYTPLDVINGEIRTHSQNAFTCTKDTGFSSFGQFYCRASDNNTVVRAFNGDLTFLVGTTGSTPVMTINTTGITPGTDNTFSCGSVGLRWTDIFAVSGSVNTSDIREKRNIVNSDRGLEFIMKLRPVSYQWKNGTYKERKNYGFIAQEIEEIIEEEKNDFGGHYSPKDDSDPQGLRYDQFISPMVKAIQELQAQVMALKEEISELKNPVP